MNRCFAVGAAVALLACGGSASTPEGEETAGGDVSQYEGDIASTDVARGAEQFEMFCGDCHPDGGEDVGPSLVDHPHSPAQLRKQIREGSGKMRPTSVARLSEEDLESVLAYLQTINAVK